MVNKEDFELLKDIENLLTEHILSLREVYRVISKSKNIELDNDMLFDLRKCYNNLGSNVDLKKIRFYCNRMSKIPYKEDIDECIRIIHEFDEDNELLLSPSSFDDFTQSEYKLFKGLLEKLKKNS